MKPTTILTFLFLQVLGNLANAAEIRYGKWIVTSSDTFNGESVGITETHFNVLHEQAGSRIHDLYFLGTSAGDAGESWRKTITFSLMKNGSLEISELESHFEPVWQFDPAGGIGSLRKTVQRSKWDGSNLAFVSSSTSVQLVQGKEEKSVPLKISGEYFSSPGVPSGTVRNESAEVIGFESDWGTPYYQVRRKDGSTGFVKPEAIKVSKRQTGKKG